MCQLKQVGMSGTALAVAPGQWPERAGRAAGATVPERQSCPLSKEPALGTPPSDIPLSIQDGQIRNLNISQSPCTASLLCDFTASSTLEVDTGYRNDDLKLWQ